jgi:PPOX class probable F420-dependent enzyme
MDCGAPAIDVRAPIPDARRMQDINAKATQQPTTLAGERYVALTTFTRDGTPKSTPVWPVDAGDGRIGFITSSQTWKVKRINNDSHVAVQPSDGKGRVREDTPAISGSAEVVLGDAFESLNRKVKAKYGFQLWVINILHALPGRKTGHRNDCAVVISLDTTRTAAPVHATGVTSDSRSS